MSIDLTQTQNVFEVYQAQDFSAIRRQYKDAGTKYCFDVLDRKVLTGYYIQLACFRHLQDLKRVGQPDFPYYYDLDYVKNILNFAAICPNVDTGEPTRLMPWQSFIMAQLIGWRANAGGKRFTLAMISVGRGQGKTYLMAIIACYSYLIESLSLYNQDFLVSSINFKQTQKIAGYIKSMLRSITAHDPFYSLKAETDLRIQNDQVIQKKTNNVLREISHEAGQYDSYHFTTAIFDEIGEIETRKKISKIATGMSKVDNHQFIQISTAYPKPDVPFHDDERKIVSAMERDFSRSSDRTLGLFWSQDSLAEAQKPETWGKSNPLLDLPDQHDTILDGLIDLRDTMQVQGNLTDFQNKNLNLWLEESADSYLKLADIERAIIPSFKITGRQVYIGYDYSMFSDNTALAFIFPYQENNKQKFYIMQHSFIPWQHAGSIETKEKQDGIAYREQAKKGFCTITSHPEGLINSDQVYQWLLNFVDHYQLKVLYFGCDAWGLTKFVKQLELNVSYPIEKIKQTTPYLKEPTKFIQTSFIEGAITRLDDKIMEKALLNAVLKETAVGIQVDKDRATLKIDVVDALIDAMYQAMYHFEDYSVANDKSKQVELMTPDQIKEHLLSGKFGF